MSRAGRRAAERCPAGGHVFCDQTLIEPHCQLETRWRKLRARSLESLLTPFTNTSRRPAQRTRRPARRHFGGARPPDVRAAESPGAGCHGPHPPSQADLDGQAARKGRIPDAGTDSRNPGRFSAAPEASLGLTPRSITVDRLGIVVSDQKVPTTPMSHARFPRNPRPRQAHLHGHAGPHPPGRGPRGGRTLSATSSTGS
jgi:hypothetical protein